MLTTTNLLIKQTSVDNLDDYFNLSSNANLMYYTPKYFCDDKEKCKSLISSQSESKYIYYSVFDKNTNEYFGQINYEVISTLNEYKLCNLCFFFGENAKDKDYEKEALDAILELMIIHKYCIKIISENIKNDIYRSLILQKAGFIEDKRVDVLFDEENTQMIIYKITKPIYVKKDFYKN